MLYAMRFDYFGSTHGVSGLKTSTIFASERLVDVTLASSVCELALRPMPLERCVAECVPRRAQQVSSAM